MGDTLSSQFQQLGQEAMRGDGWVFQGFKRFC